jgi:hypothetical protein
VLRHAAARLYKVVVSTKLGYLKQTGKISDGRNGGVVAIVNPRKGLQRKSFFFKK